MRALFWLSVGMALGVFGYRYYQDNGGRLPLLEQLLGGRTDDLARQAGETARAAQQRVQEAAGETAGTVAREAVTSVAEEIAEAEQAKRREAGRRRGATS